MSVADAEVGKQACETEAVEDAKDEGDERFTVGKDGLDVVEGRCDDRQRDRRFHEFRIELDDVKSAQCERD